MEPKRKKGKNSVKDFEAGKKQLTDDDRMDAYAITPVCLRVANAVDNLYGYIPVSKDDPKYRKEKDRADYLEFDRCECLNCNPEAAKDIHKLAHLFTKDNFDEILGNPSQFSEGVPDYIQPKKHRHNKQKYKSRLPQAAVKKIADDLIVHFEAFYQDLMDERPEFKASRFFGAAQAQAVAEAFEYIEEPSLIAKLIGGEWFDNQIDTMFLFVQTYKKTEWFEKQVFEIEKGKRTKEFHKKEKVEKKKREEEEKRHANEKRETIKIVKRAEDAIALENFKQIRAAEAEERKSRGETFVASKQSCNMQPKAKRVRLLPEDRKKRDDQIFAEKTAKRAADATALEKFKQIRATEARARAKDLEEGG